MQYYGAKKKPDILLWGNVIPRHLAGNVYALRTQITATPQEKKRKNRLRRVRLDLTNWFQDEVGVQGRNSDIS
ncbi:hypothetical protein MTR_5g025815 [Medicago truncatula]|uniref:Uncharacterized protein n=1 Tax=Medicago truncatula TaxID=3880 RepID=A0A072UP73_MEDTR|nr:hypothetical protein MTR_5g025815 [Medicago truncatula]